MEVVNEVMPGDPERLKEMLQPGPEGPVVMVNLLKFRDRAEYASDHPDAAAGLTGREAYNRYGALVVNILPDFGGRVLWSGDVTFLALGQVEELWDEVVLVEYPNRAALVAMTSSEAWQDASVHRTAGLAGQLNLEATPSAAVSGAGDAAAVPQP